MSFKQREGYKACKESPLGPSDGSFWRPETFGTGEAGPNQINSFKQILWLHMLDGPSVQLTQQRVRDKSQSSPQISSTWPLNGAAKQQRHTTHLLQRHLEPATSNRVLKQKSKLQTAKTCMNDCHTATICPLLSTRF